MSTWLPRRRRHGCLLQQAQHDPDAFAEFFDAYHERVLVFLTRRSLNAEIALDLMSETFAKALANRHRFRGATPEEEQGWLFAIARSELSHYWRRGKVERSALARLGVPVPELTSAEAERIEELAGLDELRSQLAGELATLPPEQRRAIELRVVEELDYGAVAADMGVSEDVARARVSRGLRALNRRLTGVEIVGEAQA